MCRQRTIVSRKTWRQREEIFFFFFKRQYEWQRHVLREVKWGKDWKVSIELSNSKLISNCGRNIFSREVGQKPALTGLRNQWEAGSGDSEVSFFPSAGKWKEGESRRKLTDTGGWEGLFSGGQAHLTGDRAEFRGTAGRGEHGWGQVLKRQGEVGAGPSHRFLFPPLLPLSSGVSSSVTCPSVSLLELSARHFCRYPRRLAFPSPARFLLS